MKLKKIALAAGLSLFTATASFAATFTINGNDFDVTTITGTFDDNQALLESQVWWGDQTLAIEFASAVNFDLGLPNFGVGGPFFAYSSASGFLGIDIDLAVSDPFGSFGFFDGSGIAAGAIADAANTHTYAIATPLSAVPLPAGGLLLLTGLGGVAAFKRRKKRSA